MKFPAKAMHAPACGTMAVEAAEREQANHTVLAGDTDTNGIASASPINLSGGTIQDAAGNSAVLTFTAPNTTGAWDWETGK